MTRPVYNCTPKLRLMDSTLVDSSRPMSALTRHIQELCKGSFMWGSCILAIWRRALRSRKLRQPSCASRKKASCSRSAYSGMRVHCVSSRSGRSDGTQGRQAAPSPTIPKQSAMFSSRTSQCQVLLQFRRQGEREGCGSMHGCPDEQGSLTVCV